MLNLNWSVDGFFLTGLNIQQNKDIDEPQIVNKMELQIEYECDEVAEYIDNYKLLAVVDAPRTVSKTDVSSFLSFYSIVVHLHQLKKGADLPLVCEFKVLVLI